MTDRKRSANNVLRRIREEERQESRSEFANALAKVARDLGEPIAPSERYIARLEDGEVKYPSAPYRRVLTQLCARPMTELGFMRRYPDGNDANSGPTQASRDRLALTNRARGSSLIASVAAADAVVTSEWPIWFGARVAHLITLVDGWHDGTGQYDSLQAILHQEVLMFDALMPDGDNSDELFHALSRRQALTTIAALPVALSASVGSAASALGVSAATEAFLSRCAASLTACWHLLRGADLDVVHQIISAYIVGLEGIAGKESRHKSGAARLASQAHRICGIVALHRDQLKAREIHCKQALFYAEIASDASSRVSALISLASTYFYCSDPARAAAIYEQAFDLEADMPSLQRSRVHAELSVVYGQLGREQEAIRSTGLAEDCYPDNPEQDRSFLYAEFTPASLTLEQGLAYVALAGQYPGHGHARKAAEIFAHLGDATSAVPDRIRYEIINHQAATAVHMNDLEAFESFMASAFEGVAILGSVQRRKEARHAWRIADQRWPREPRIKALGEHARLVGIESPGMISE
jgi:tetratricopeptide (TPR) repeat protein